MKKFMLCLGVFCSLEVQASTVLDTWEQWNPLSRLWEQEQAQAAPAQDEEAPAVSGEVSAEVSETVHNPQCGVLISFEEVRGQISCYMRLFVPTCLVNFMRQRIEEVKQGNFKIIGVIAVGSAGVMQLIRILWE